MLKLDDQYQFLINDQNEEKTDRLLVIEVVPKDQDLQTWHEIHPTWQVVKQ